MTGFKKMNVKQMHKEKGGSGLLIAAGLVATMLIKAVISGITSYKMLQSSKGSVKIDGYESHWENKEPKHTKPNSEETHFYVY